jgi:hypothetical protein
MALAVLIPVVGVVGLVDSIAVGASAHRTTTSAGPSTAKLQKEITALQKELPKTYLSAAKAKKTYLSSASAATTYLKTATAAANLVNGNGYVMQGSANLADVHAQESEPLFITRDGLEFGVRTDPAAAATVQLTVTNGTGLTKYLVIGTTEVTLLNVGSPSYNLPLSNGQGAFVVTVASASAPLEVDTLTIGQQSSGGADQIWAQLVHTGSAHRRVVRASARYSDLRQGHVHRGARLATICSWWDSRAAVGRMNRPLASAVTTPSCRISPVVWTRRSSTDSVRARTTRGTSIGVGLR